MLDEEFYEKVRRVIDQLVDEPVENVVVLVEGVRDEKVVRMMGYRGKIMLVSRFRKEIEYIKPKKVILLLDFDREGLKNMRKLAKQLSAMGYRVDNTYHNRLRIVKRAGINTVEGIRKLLPTL